MAGGVLKGGGSDGEVEELKERECFLGGKVK